jgi:putative acetyltransferase
MTRARVKVGVASGGAAPGLETLYRHAFADEDLSTLVERLLREVPDLLSLVATLDTRIVGHVLFSPCEVRQHDRRVALLGPLAVAPDWQIRGIGSTLVREGLDILAGGDVVRVLVLGDPVYYRRFGFAPETAVRPPYPLPAHWRDAWRSIDLGGRAATVRGELRPPAAWLSPELWAP